MRTAFILFVMALITAGCVRFHPHPLSPSRNVSALEAGNLEDPGLKEFLQKKLHHEVTPWPPRTWDFSLLTLAAFYHHTKLEVARAQWKKAEAAVVTAAGRPNPSIALDPEYVSNASWGLSPLIAGFSLDIPIETAGRRVYRIIRARYLAQAARLKVASVAWEVRSRLRGALLDLYQSKQRAFLLRGQEANQEEIVRLFTRRLSVGEASRFELNREQILLDKIRVSIQEEKKRASEARAGLAEALGIPVEVLRGINISFDFLDTLPPTRDIPAENIRFQALTSRADIQSALAEYAASQAALQLEIARQYPNIHLGPGYLFDQGDQKWVLGLAVTLPILNQNQGPIAEASARRQEVSARFNVLQARIVGQLDLASASYRAALQEVAASQSLLAARKRQLKSTEAMFAVGEVDRMDLLRARKDAAAGALGRLKAFFKAQQALGRLEEAVQGCLGHLQPCPAPPEEAVLQEKESRQ